MQRIALIGAIGFGWLLAYIDSRPGWDDTGVIVVAVTLMCGILGAAAPKRPWLWALAVGVWIPLFDVALNHNFGALAALLFAFAGAYLGMAFRKGLSPT